MNKKKHIQTNFFRFLLEKYSNDQNTQSDIEFDDEVETPDEEIDDEQPKRIKRMVEFDDEVEDPERTEDDDIIDELVKEYKKIKKQYENRRISIRRKR